MTEIENLLKRVDIKAAKLDPKAKYIFCVNLPGEANDAYNVGFKIRKAIQEQVPEAVVLVFTGEVECQLFGVGTAPATKFPLAPLIQDREASRRI